VVSDAPRVALSELEARLDVLKPEDLQASIDWVDNYSLITA
jgi:hypothetical protein